MIQIELLTGCARVLQISGHRKSKGKEKIESHGNRDILELATNQKDTEPPKGVVKLDT